jgi:hypothetical protein
MNLYIEINTPLSYTFFFYSFFIYYYHTCNIKYIGIIHKKNCFHLLAYNVLINRHLLKVRTRYNIKYQNVHCVSLFDITIIQKCIIRWKKLSIILIRSKRINHILSRYVYIYIYICMYF